MWKSIDEEALFWKPDPEAMNCIEMVRHALEAENIYHHIVLHRGELGDYVSPLSGNPYSTIDNELRYAQPYREKFLKMVNGFTQKELEEVYYTN